MSCLAKVDREEDHIYAQDQQGKVGRKDEDNEEFDPWSSVKKYF